MSNGTSQQKLDVLPALDPFLGTLPPSPSPYRVTLADLHQTFVVEAPFRERRETLFAALQPFTGLIWSITPAARLWIDGGFVTHKDWAEPDDIDIAIVADLDNSVKRRLAQRGLLTMTDVTASVNGTSLPQIEELRPFGGLIDAYLVTTSTQELFRRQWSNVRGPNGEVLKGIQKGFVEVVHALG